MKKHFSTVILIFVFLIGLSLLLYPSLSNYWNSFHASRAVASYSEEVANLDEEEYIRMLEEAKEYNRTLLGRGNHVDFQNFLNLTLM